MDVLVVVAALFLGACLGSFANVCIWRLPRPGLSPASPARSLCPRCGFRLAWFDNVPILSWCILGGSCRRCGGRIAFRYTLVEFLTALAVLAVAARFLLPGGDGWHPQVDAFIFWTLVVWGLLISAFIDLELMLLPDEIVLPLLALTPCFFVFCASPFGPAQDELGLALARAVTAIAGQGLGLGAQGAAVAAALGGAAAGAAYGEYVRRTTQWESRGHFLAAGIPFYVLGATVGAAVGGIAAAPELLDRFPGVAAFVSLSGAIVGAGLVWLVRVLGRFAFAQEAMGFGDVKLMALLGALTGVGGILWTLALASVLGSVIGIARYACTRERQLPFGPFLIAGALAALLARTELKDFLDWYKSLVVRG